MSRLTVIAHFDRAGALVAQRRYAQAVPGLRTWVLDVGDGPQLGHLEATAAARAALLGAPLGAVLSALLVGAAVALAAPTTTAAAIAVAVALSGGAFFGGAGRVRLGFGRSAGLRRAFASGVDAGDPTGTAVLVARGAPPDGPQQRARWDRARPDRCGPRLRAGDRSPRRRGPALRMAWTVAQERGSRAVLRCRWVPTACRRAATERGGRGEQARRG